MIPVLKNRLEEIINKFSEIESQLSDNEIDTLIHSGTYYLSCLMTLSQYEKVKKNRVLFSDLE